MIGPAPASFALDFDGTLVALVDDPAAVAVEPWVPALLDRLRARDDRVTILTGRPASFVGARLPGVRVVGMHGLEWPGEPLPAREPLLDLLVAWA
ncbi:MAG: trehalose-phosphatase, partial [Myxococcota bacterium]